MICENEAKLKMFVLYKFNTSLLKENSNENLSNFLPVLSNIVLRMD